MLDVSWPSGSEMTGGGQPTEGSVWDLDWCCGPWERQTRCFMYSQRGSCPSRWVGWSLESCPAEHKQGQAGGVVAKKSGYLPGNHLDKILAKLVLWCWNLLQLLLFCLPSLSTLPVTVAHGWTMGLANSSCCVWMLLLDKVCSVANLAKHPGTGPVVETACDVVGPWRHSHMWQWLYSVPYTYIQ